MRDMLHLSLHTSYDTHMQKALMESKICLLNAGATGTEILKNLVLPGCGTVCIVDSRFVTTHDCENNFFVTRGHIGEPLAKVCLRVVCSATTFFKPA
jgi:amyloid beta precursor protein binding protein 1